MHPMIRIIPVLLAAVLTLGWTAGCTTERHTTVRETETRTQPPPRVIEEHSTTIERGVPPPPSTESRTIIRKRSESVDEDDED